jgi:hypothetical protein
MKMKQQCSMFKIFLAASFILLNSFSEARITKIKRSLLFAPHHLGDVALLHSEEKGFWVVQNGREHSVDDFLLDPQLQGISSDTLDAFLCDGLISIIPHDSGEFELEACHSEAGKGPLAGVIAGAAARGVAWLIVAKGYRGAIGIDTSESGKFLGFVLTEGASEGVTAAAGTIEQVTALSPELATAGAKTGAGIAAAGGAIAAIPVIEAVAHLTQVIFSALAFLP